MQTGNSSQRWVDAAGQLNSMLCRIEDSYQGRSHQPRRSLMKTSKTEMIAMDSFDSLTSRIESLLPEYDKCPRALATGETQNPNSVDAFDLNQYLAQFPRLSISKGHRLDYIYVCDHKGGEPFPYIRKENEAPIQDLNEYRGRYGFSNYMLIGQEPTSQSILPFTTDLEIEHTAEGFFEYFIFLMKIRRFYLFWHSNYNKRLFFYSIEELKREKKELERQNVDMLQCTLMTMPKVTMENDKVMIQVLSTLMNEGTSVLTMVLSLGDSQIHLNDVILVPSELRIIF
jgi:hypothetical protein